MIKNLQSFHVRNLRFRPTPYQTCNQRLIEKYYRNTFFDPVPCFMDRYTQAENVSFVMFRVAAKKKKKREWDY